MSFRKKEIKILRKLVIKELNLKGFSDDKILKLLRRFLGNDKIVNLDDISTDHIEQLRYYGLIEGKYLDDPKFKTITSKIRSTITGVLLIVDIIFIFLAMSEGADEFYPASGIISIVIFSLLLFVIFIFEGFEIAITKLTAGEQFKEELSDYLRNKNSRSNFLGARQIILLLFVFIAAQLTTFPHLTKFPYTNIPLILTGTFHEATYIMDLLFLRWGLAGAFIVAVFAQLLPKIIANNMPLKFLHEKGKYLLLFFDAVGAPSLLYRIVRRIKNDQIPPSRVSALLITIKDSDFCPDKLNYEYIISYEVLLGSSLEHSKNLQVDHSIDQLNFYIPHPELKAGAGNPTGTLKDCKVTLYDVEANQIDQVFLNSLTSLNGTTAKGGKIKVTMDSNLDKLTIDPKNGFPKGSTVLVESHIEWDKPQQFESHYFVVDMDEMAIEKAIVEIQANVTASYSQWSGNEKRSVWKFEEGESPYSLVYFNKTRPYLYVEYTLF